MTKFAYLLILLVLPEPASACLGDDLRDAVRDGSVDRVKSLLESGADANSKYENGYTPIYFAADPKIVDLLIAHGAKLNIRDRAGLQSPIEDAAEQYDLVPEHRETWRTIVAKMRDAGAEYTINAAIYMNDVPFVEKRLATDRSWVNKRGGAQCVPLRVAARTGRLKICKLLLKHGADPNAFEEGVGHPIMVNAVKHPAVVKLLIEHRANLRRRITWRGGRSGSWIIGDEASALHYAVKEGNLESVKLLLAAGLDPNAADDRGQTPLHIAVSLSVIKPQLDADLRHLNGRGDPPQQETYHFADLVAVLLENDASVSFADRSGKTPLDWADGVKIPEEIRKLLRRSRAVIDAKFRHAMFDDQ
jgi:ankyrin repeat protein